MKVNKRVYLTICLCINLVFTQGIFGDNVYATTGKRAISSYKKILEGSKVKIGGKEYQKSETIFSISDLNNDGIPEMILINKKSSYGDSSIILVTYYKGYAKQLYNDMWREDILYKYQKGSVFFLQGKQGSIWKNYYGISKGKLVDKAFYSSDDGYGKKHYKVSGKSVSKKNITNTLEKLQKAQ